MTAKGIAEEKNWLIEHLPNGYFSFEWAFVVVPGDVDTVPTAANLPASLHFAVIPPWGFHLGGCVWYPTLGALHANSKPGALTGTYTLFTASRKSRSEKIPGDFYETNPHTPGDNWYIHHESRWRIRKAWTQTAPTGEPEPETTAPAPDPEPEAES